MKETYNNDRTVFDNDWSNQFSAMSSVESSVKKNKPETDEDFKNLYEKISEKYNVTRDDARDQECLENLKNRITKTVKFGSNGKFEWSDISPALQKELLDVYRYNTIKKFLKVVYESK